MTEEQEAPLPVPGTLFVPTLTEVARPEVGSADGLSITEPVVAPAAADAAADLAGQVLARLQPELEQRIAEAISHALHEQMQGLHARVQQAVASEVRRTVAQVLRQSASDPGT